MVKIEIATISNTQNKNKMEVRYNFTKKELYNVTYNLTTKVNLIEYKKIKDTTIRTAKKNNWTLKFITKMV